MGEDTVLYGFTAGAFSSMHYFLLPIFFCYNDVAVERVELRARMALSGYNRRQSAETVLCRKVSGFD